MLSQPRAFVDFTPPRLHKGAKEWYVYYYVRNPETGKMKRFRVKVNRYHSVKEKLAAARAVIAALSEKLALGWNPLFEHIAPKAGTPAYEVFDAFERAKAKEMEKQSLASYRSYVNCFRKWMIGRGATQRTLISSITHEHARAYLDYLDDIVSPATWNNYLSFMVTFFTWIRKKGYIKDNPFEGFDRKPKRLTKKKRHMFDAEQLETLFSYLAKENPEFLSICLLCYCCFIRPKEISLLRCSDIDLEKQVVHVSEEIAKNDNESFRTIPDAAMPALRKLDLSHPEWFAFGYHAGNAKDFTPGKTPTTQKKIGHFWRRFVEPVCKFGKGISFYSLKDTGITRTLSEGVALNFVQQQADHSSPAITGIYVAKTALAIEKLKGVDIMPGHPLPGKGHNHRTLELTDEK